MKRNIFCRLYLCLPLILLTSNLHAELRDWGPDGQYFYDTDTGLYWWDPAEFVGWSYSDINAFVTASAIWKRASSDEIDALVGKSSEEGVPLTEVMDPYQFQTGALVDGIWYYGFRWIGYFENSPNQPDGRLVQTFFDHSPPVINDLSTLGDSRHQMYVGNWTHGAWINSTVTPCEDFVWPLSGCSTPDEMATSFGPRVNYRKWDFHDGIDLPAPRGTPICAARGGQVLYAGDGGEDGYSSRHVVLQVDDPADGAEDLYLVYLHLDSYLVNTGDEVILGQQIGTVGDDDATYPHLHFEIRKGDRFEINSLHPLDYLPYADMENFTAPVLDRANQLGDLTAVRLLFDAPDRNEGDLLGVEVNLTGITREVNFNNKQTVNEGNNDDLTYVDDIGVEGYQRSNMVDDGRSDLKYGILVRNIPDYCTMLDASVMDVGDHEVTTIGILIPVLTVTDEHISFENTDLANGVPPPAGWDDVTSSTGDGTTIETATKANHAGSQSDMMLSTDNSGGESSTQRAGIQFNLPLEPEPKRFEWVAEAWFKPTSLGLGENQNLYLLYFLGETTLDEKKLSVAARIRHVDGGTMRAGIIAREKPDGDFKVKNGDPPTSEIATDQWRHWRLHLLRIGTRETTAVLYLDGREQARLNWDTTELEPKIFRAGIGLTSAGATATVLTDDLCLSEKSRSAFVELNTPEGDDVEVTPVGARTETTPVTVTFDQVTGAGKTSLTTSSSGPPPPLGFKLGDPTTYYELTTSAEFSGAIEVCIDYSGVSVGNEANLELFHFEGGVPVDVTSSLDTDNDIICGTATSLSPFAIFESIAPQTVKWSARDALDALLPTGDKKIDKRIEKALKHLEKSLDPKLPETDSTLTKKGKKVFDEEKKAVKDLQNLIKDKKVPDYVKDVCKEMIDKLVTADKLLAKTALNDAREYEGTDKKVDKETEKSEKELEKATKELEKGKPDKAIDHYKKAWEHARKAMKKVP